jgi:beta-xylosidase
MTVKEYVNQALECLDESQLQQVAEYVAFLKFRARAKGAGSLDPTELAALYAEFADEDLSLAEEGLHDYAEHLASEDSA